MTLTQQMSALARANDVRFAQSRVKKAVRDGRMDMREALGESCVASMPVGKLLGCQSGWGPVKLGKLFRALEGYGVPVGVYRPVGQLTGRQVEALCGMLERAGRKADAQARRRVEACEGGKT